MATFTWESLSNDGRGIERRWSKDRRGQPLSRGGARRLSAWEHSTVLITAILGAPGCKSNLQHGLHLGHGSSVIIGRDLLLPSLLPKKVIKA